MGTEFSMLNTYLEFVCMVSLCLVATGALVFYFRCIYFIRK